MTRVSILIIHPDPGVAEQYRKTLDAAGVDIVTASTGRQGLALARSGNVDLILVNLRLSDMSGFDVCREVKLNRSTANLPLVFTADHFDETDIVTALELGADDYVTHPVNDQLFLGKIRSLLRRPARPGQPRPGAIRVHGIAIDPQRHEVRVGDRPVGLTVTEFRLLRLLASHPGQTFRREEILARLSGRRHMSSERAVDVQIAGLRRRLGAYGNRIETVRGVGYRLRVH